MRWHPQGCHLFCFSYSSLCYVASRALVHAEHCEASLNIQMSRIRSAWQREWCVLVMLNAVKHLLIFRCLTYVRHDREPCVRNLKIFGCLAFARHDKGSDCRMDIIGFFLPVFRWFYHRLYSVVYSQAVRLLFVLSVPTESTKDLCA